MNINWIVLSFTSDEVIRVTRILLGEDKEDAFTFIKEVLKPQVDQATWSQ